MTAPQPQSVTPEQAAKPVKPIDDFDYRRPLCEEEKQIEKRGYKFPYRRGICFYDLDDLIQNCIDEPEPSLIATGCEDPHSAAEFVYRMGLAMPGVYRENRRCDINIKTRNEVYNAAVIHGASLMRTDNAKNIVAQNLILAQSWAMFLLSTVGKSEGGLDQAQERAVRLASKFMDLVNRQAELLDRLKHGSRQTVRVEKVVVEAGGQAVVGVVQPGQGGGGQA